jgi:hypothetical protein
MLQWSVGGEPQEKTPIRGGLRATRLRIETAADLETEVIQTPQHNTQHVSFESRNKEDLYSRIDHRDKIAQIGTNPFHHGAAYVADIEVQEKFLRSRGGGGGASAGAPT